MTFPKIKDSQFSKISYCLSKFSCPDWQNSIFWFYVINFRRYFVVCCRQSRLICSLTQKLLRSRDLCIISFRRAFVIKLGLLALICFCFLGECLSKTFKKLSLNSFNSALLISIFINSLFSSKLKDCS